ncbi:MAG TPA: DNA methyltransferase, partial [Candidatus Polarisedimenticolia bacterium]|nr:DNA methyltransferase [Candidatus Polarisedimenticolia bacterium]
VLDPFGGSGTTYVACEAAGRRWLGCEREEEYCRLIARRLGDPGRLRAGTAGESPRRKARRRADLRGRAGV